MFRKSVITVLIFSMLALLVRFTFPYVWFYTNFEYVAGELCINRHNPNSDCDGSCQLKKMVQHHTGDHDAHEGKTTLPNDSRPYISLYYQQSTVYSFSEKSGDQPFSSTLDLLKTQFIKTPSTPPPIFAV